MESGHIKARTKWKEIYPAFRDDDRYLSMLSNPGSNPLELFWDAVDILDQKLDEKIGVAEAAIERHNAELPAGEDKKTVNGDAQEKQGEDSEETQGFSVGPNTTEKEFKAIIKGKADDAANALTNEDLHIIFNTVSSWNGIRYMITLTLVISFTA